MLIEGRGSARALTSWRQHVRLCDACATAVTQLRAGLEAEPTKAPNATKAPAPTEKNCLTVGLEPNLRLGDFLLERRLGAGGMGVVYQAQQISLKRQVALKVLPSGTCCGKGTIERFHREARAAAKLHHPNIVTIYADGIEQGICYFAMEMIEGQGLDQVIEDLRSAKASEASASPSDDVDRASPSRRAPADSELGGQEPIPCLLRDCESDREYFETVALVISEVAEALAYAHNKGIIHRDVKPSNLMLTRDGRLILLDFGIARICQEQAMTLTGSFVGTPRYMSPEQIRGRSGEASHYSDIYSLGVTLYELLTLETLFDGNSHEQVIHRILNEDPARPRQLDRRIPIDLETICCKAMEKEPSRRYQNADAMAEDLRRYLSGRVIAAKPPRAADRVIKLVRRRKLATVLASGIVVMMVFAAMFAWKHYSVQWAQQDAMAEIDHLIEQDRYFDALLLAKRADHYVPDNPLLKQRWPLLSREFTILTHPPNAEVMLGQYDQEKANWKNLGRAPLRGVRIPFGTYRWKVEKAGFTPLEVVISNDLPSSSTDLTTLPSRRLVLALHRPDEVPAGMVRIPEADLRQDQLFYGTGCVPAAPPFLIDKHEVTNRQYKAFVAHGGYEDQRFWVHEFVRNGKVIPWSEAVNTFRDQTGRYGPSNWKNGTYPPRCADFPVGGISWYEAAAFARFQGKALPTIYHWLQATGPRDHPYRIARFGNFGKGPLPVGRSRGMGQFGLYDAAGNVREWCLNTIQGQPEKRCILGGGWSDHAFMFVSGEIRSPWDRDPVNGMRCVIYLSDEETVPPAAFEPIEHRHRDFSNFKPVSQEEFDSIISMSYSYDRTELNAQIESVDNTDAYVRQRVTFDAAYPNERIIAYLHLPDNVTPPYQPVIWFPASDATDSPWDENAYKDEMKVILDSGRAVIAPFYKGTYERRLERPFYPPGGVQSRNLYIQRSQDLRRTVDYLQSREDIDMNDLAYVGLGWGAEMGPLMIATEDRFKTGILLLGGISACRRHPASDPANFAPRIEIPILMINGREDSVFPYETAQRPLFDLLGTPPAHKRHIRLPSGRCIGWPQRKAYATQIEAWLDQYLGPVSRANETIP